MTSHDDSRSPSKKQLSRAFCACLLVWTCIISQVSAATETCPLFDGPAPALASYMEKSEWLLTKISEEAGKSTCKTDATGKNSATDTIDKTVSSFVGGMNGILDFSNFFTSGRFYVDIVLKTEIPRGITRDHERLGRTIDRLRDVYVTVYGRCAADKVLTRNLSDEPSYDTTGKTMGSVLKDMLKNQTNMINYYRETVLGDKTADKYSFILVGDHYRFASSMENAYGPKAFEKCNKESDFFKDIKVAINRISSLWWGIEKGMQAWKDAAGMLDSNSSESMTVKVSVDVSNGEASMSMGISPKRADNVVNNLGKYSSQNAHEGISGYVGAIGERVHNGANQVGSMFDDIKKKLQRPQTTDQYLQTYQNFQAIKNDIFDELKADYILSKDLMGPENQATDLNVSSLISTHLRLEETDTKITPFIKVAQEVCNAQGKNLSGNCRF